MNGIRDGRIVVASAVLLALAGCAKMNRPYSGGVSSRTGTLAGAGAGALAGAAASDGVIAPVAGAVGGAVLGEELAEPDPVFE